MTLRLVAATANEGKLAEIAVILAPQIAPRPASVGVVEETEETLEANARLKAVAVCRASGEPAVADDTGLEVRALDGRPGVHSARYAGLAGDESANRAKLLAELEGIDDRRARFRTVALALWPDGTEVSAEGVVEGLIAWRERGDAGFAYDSVFVPIEGDGRTFAEMSIEEKNAISHRGRAFRGLAGLLPAP